MLSTLIQTIANLGFDSSVINEAFNQVIATIQNGDTSTLAGLGGIFTNIISIFTGVSAADIATVISSLVSSVIEVLTNDSTASVLSTITGA